MEEEILDDPFGIDIEDHAILDVDQMDENTLVDNASNGAVNGEKIKENDEKTVEKSTNMQLMQENQNSTETTENLLQIASIETLKIDKTESVPMENGIVETSTDNTEENTENNDKEKTNNQNEISTLKDTESREEKVENTKNNDKELLKNDIKGKIEWIH